MPLISIIMPLYNKRPYVKRAINSVQQQTFANWELIIIDDGSTDGSSDAIPKDDNRILLFKQTNAGPSAARNHGIKMAQGRFVTFLDADDHYYPYKLEREIKYLFKQEKAEWMLSARHIEEGNNLILKRFRDIDGKELTTEVAVFDNAPGQLSLQGIGINALCIKKYLLERVGGFNEKMRSFEIFEFMIRCALEEPKILIYPIPLCSIVKVPNSAFEILPHRIHGFRQLGESLHNLSRLYPSHSDYLVDLSREHFISYTRALISCGKRHEARRFLTKELLLFRDKQWWKTWICTWLPEFLLKRSI